MLYTLSLASLFYLLFQLSFALFPLPFNKSSVKSYLTSQSLINLLFPCLLKSFNSLYDICWTFIQLRTKHLPLNPLLLRLLISSSPYLLNFGIEYCMVVHTENVLQFFLYLIHLVHYVQSFVISLTKSLLPLESIVFLVQTHFLLSSFYTAQRICIRSVFQLL